MERGEFRKVRTLTMEEREDTTTDAGKSRREFLTAGAAVAGLVAAGAIAAGPAEAAPAMKEAGGIPVPTADAKKLWAGKYPKGTKMATGKVLGANDRINIGFVGVGGQGYNAHVRSYSERFSDWNVMPVAVADVYQGNLNRALGYIKEKTKTDAFGDRDYRKVLERPEIDAIVVATPEHWHGQVAVHAMQAGKHVYCEKPMVRYLDEAFQVYDTRAATNRVIQIGSQGCSDVRWHATAKAIKEGKIGKIVMGQGSYCRNNRKGEWNYGIPKDLNPETLLWDRWLGSAPSRPFVNPGGAGGDEQPDRDDSGSRWRATESTGTTRRESWAT